MTAMKIAIPEAGGDFTIDAALVAEGFGWSNEMLRDNMRRGLVTSVVERGEGEDEGKWRLSMRCGNRRWQAVIGRDDTVAEQHVAFTRSPG